MLTRGAKHVCVDVSGFLKHGGRQKYEGRELVCGEFCEDWRRAPSSACADFGAFVCVSRAQKVRGLKAMCSDESDSGERRCVTNENNSYM